MLDKALVVFVMTGTPLGVAWICYRQLRPEATFLRMLMTYFVWVTFICWSLWAPIFFLETTIPISQQMPDILLFIPISMLFPIGYILGFPFVLLGLVET